MSGQERVQAFAKTALALMAEREVAPTPENFQLFYAFTAGENPAVSRVLGDMISHRSEFPQAVLDDLRNRFFSSARMEATVETLGTEITGAVNSVLQKLANAERDTVAYGRTLSEASGELGGGQSPAEMRKLVDGLLGATQAMEARTKNLEAELQRSAHEVSELKTKLDDVRKESLTDPLTDIPNRKAFDLELNQAVEWAHKHSEPLSLFMCDIDHFKNFNDTWGHQTGDQVLRLVGTLPLGKRQRPRYGGALWRRGIRRHPAPDAARSGDASRQPDPLQCRKQEAGEALHRRHSGHHHHLDRRVAACSGRNTGLADSTGRCMPLRSQEFGPQLRQERRQEPAHRRSRGGLIVRFPARARPPMLAPGTFRGLPCERTTIAPI